MDKVIVCFACLIGLLAAPTSRGADGNADRLPIEYFAKYDEFGRVRLSPDGETIAVATAKKRTATLSIIGVPEGRVYGSLANNQHEFGDFEWVSNTRLVYTLSEYYGDITIPRNKGEMLAIDRDLKNHAMIYGFRERNPKQDASDIPILQPSNKAVPTIVSTLRHDDKVLLAEQKWRQDAAWFRFDPDVNSKLSWMDVHTGAKQDLGSVPVGGTDILLDKDELPRIALGVDEHAQPTLSWKPQGQAPWKLVTLPAFNAASLRIHLFADDDETLFVTAATESEPLISLYRVNLKSLAIAKVFQFEDADIDEIIFDFSRRKIIGVAGQSGKPVYHWFDENDPVAKMYAGLQKSFPTLFVGLNGASRDRLKAIVTLWSDTHPGEVYLVDTPASKTTLLFALRKWIDPKRMRQKEPFTVKARDGLPLHGYLTRPTGDGPYPLVVMPHDGPHLRDSFRFDPLVQLLANRGFAVLQVNYRGSTGFGIDFQTASNKLWGTQLPDDIADATRWAFEQKVSTADRTCIYGKTFGAYAAMMNALRESALYTCAIGEAGLYDLELLFAKSEPHNVRSERAALEPAIGKTKDELRTQSPAYNAEKLQIPVLLLYGTEAWRPDLEQTKRMRLALEKSKKPYESAPLSRETLFMYDDDARRELYERVLAFLDKHIGHSK